MQKSAVASKEEADISLTEEGPPMPSSKISSRKSSQADTTSAKEPEADPQKIESLPELKKMLRQNNFILDN